MNRATKLNWIRSGLVVIGSLAFGYISLEIGFKPFLLRAQQQVVQNHEETLNRESWEVRQNQEETPNRES